MTFHFQVLTAVLFSCFLQFTYVTTNNVVEDVLSMEMPIKYPNLKKLSDMYWATLEDVNSTNEYGQETLRTTRNVLSSMLNSEEFWSLLESKVKRYGKTTNDKICADKSIRVMDFMTAIMTNPIITKPKTTKLFHTLVENAYTTTVEFNTEPYTNALEKAIVTIDSGVVNNDLDVLTKNIDNVNLDPEKLSKLFLMLRKMINLGGKVLLDFRSKAPKNVVRTSSGFK